MTPLQAVEAFQAIWKFWPNKDDLGGSMTGFKYVAASEGLDSAKLIMAAECYCSEVDIEYCHRLGNWIRDGHYLGWYSLDDAQLSTQLAKLKANTEQCRTLIESWNKCHQSCNKFYPCLATEDRIALIKKAMRSNFFKDNHLKGLRKLYVLMNTDFDKDDPRSYIKCTLQWFCSINPDKFTLAKILEGEYGEPPRIKKSKTQENEEEQQQNDFSAPEEALRFFNSLNK